MGRLRGRVALITGSTRGIGNTVAQRLAAEGARVVVHGRDDRAVAAAAGAIDGAVGVTGAMEDREQVRSLCERALDLTGTVDIVVNNAGASVHHSFLDDSDEEWDHMLAVNLFGPREVLRCLLPGMQRTGWGRIVNVTSEAGIRGTAGYPAYAASKGALVALSLTLSLELADTGVRVNAFAPVALTDLVRSQVTPRTLEYLVDRGFPTVEECAERLLPLVYDDAPSGQVVLMHLGSQPTEIVPDLSTSSEHAVVEYNPFARNTQINPYPVYRWLRDDSPVYHNPDVGFYALSRFDDVLRAHLDTTRFLSGHGVTIEDTGTSADLLITKDEPEHTWHRKLVSRVLHSACDREPGRCRAHRRRRSTREARRARRDGDHR